MTFFFTLFFFIRNLLENPGDVLQLVDRVRKLDDVRAHVHFFVHFNDVEDFCLTFVLLDRPLVALLVDFGDNRIAFFVHNSDDNFDNSWNLTDTNLVCLSGLCLDLDS